MMKIRAAAVSNTMANENDDVMTSKRVKPKKSSQLTNSDDSNVSKSRKEKSPLDDGMSSRTSKSKKETSNNDDRLSTKSKKEKKTSNETKANSIPPQSSSKSMNTMEALHASYGSGGSGSFASIGYNDASDGEEDDDDNEQFMTPRQSLSPSPTTFLSNNKQKQIGSSDRQQIMTPMSPKRPIPLKEDRVPILEGKSTKKKKSSTTKSSKGNIDLNQSCPSLFNENTISPRSSSWGKSKHQSKKVAIPNPKEPTKVKTTFLEDCSDSSDSEHEKERKRIRKATKKKEQEKAQKAQAKAVLASQSKMRRRSSIGPTVVPVLVPASKKDRSVQRHDSVSSDAIYCKYHQKAATKIASVVRMHLERIRYRICQLQRQLDTMGQKTDDDIAEIYVALEISKQDWEQKAHERYHKNVQRSDKTLNVQEAQELIHKIRNENTDFRERNAQLLSDIEKLRINNERLEHANKESSDFTNRLVYHQEIVDVEHAKLLKVHAQYEDAVKKHEDHLNLHIAHSECEHRGRHSYGQVLGQILDKMDTYRDRDEQLLCDLYEIVQALELEHGKIERQAVVDNETTTTTGGSNSDSKKDKKKKNKTKKREA